MSERPPDLNDEIHDFKAPSEETGDSSKKGFFASALDSAKEKVSASWEKLTDKEQMAALPDKAGLVAEKAVESIGEYGKKGWEAVRHDAIPLIRRMIENKKVQLSTVEGAYGLVTSVLISAVLKRATVAGIRNVGNVAAPVLGSIAGAVAGGAIGGYERYVSEQKRIINERGYASYEALLSQEEIEKLKPTDRVRRLVAAKSFLNRERSRFESKGFYGDKGQEQQQLEMLRARLEAIDLSTAMSGGELGRRKNIYDRLSKALEARDSVDKELSAFTSRDLELIKKCERKLSSGVDGAKVRRGIMVGGLVGGLGGLVGGLVGNWYFGSHGSGAPKLSVNPEAVSSPHPETMTVPASEVPEPKLGTVTPSQEFVPATRDHIVGDTDPFSGKPVFPESHVIDNKPSITPIETPKAPVPEVDASAKPAVVPPEATPKAPVETPVEPKPSAPPVEVEKPSTSAPIETGVVDKNPSSITLEKGQTIWGEVERISKANGVELSLEEHNELTRAIAEENHIAIKADGVSLKGDEIFDTELQPGHELNMSKSHELINQKLAARVSLPVDESVSKPGGGSPEAPPPATDTATPPDTTPNGNTPPIEHSGAKTPDGQELTNKNSNSDNTNTETNLDNSNSNANTNTDGKAVDSGQESPANTNETDPNASADQGGNTNEKPPVDNPDGQGEGQASADNPPAPETSAIDYAKTVTEYAKTIGKNVIIVNALGGLALGSIVGGYVGFNYVYNRITKNRLGKNAESTDREASSETVIKPEELIPKAEAPVIESSSGSLPNLESTTETATVDTTLEAILPTQENKIKTWEKIGTDRGLIGVGLDNFVKVMRDDGKSDLNKFVDAGYIGYEEFLTIRRLLLSPKDYSKLKVVDKIFLQKAFNAIYQIKDNNPRSVVNKLISRIVSWNPVVLGPLAAEVDESRKTRRVRKTDKKTTTEKLPTSKSREAEVASTIPEPEIPKPVPEVTPEKKIETTPEIIKNPEFMGAPFEAGKSMMPNTLERYELGNIRNQFIISRNSKTGELETVPKMKRLGEAQNYYQYYREYFDIADGQTASSGNIELIKPAILEYNADGDTFKLKEKGVFRITQ